MLIKVRIYCIATRKMSNDRKYPKCPFIDGVKKIEDDTNLPWPCLSETHDILFDVYVLHFGVI